MDTRRAVALLREMNRFNRGGDASDEEYCEAFALGALAIEAMEARRSLDAAANASRAGGKYSELPYMEQRKINRIFTDAENSMVKAEDAYLAAAHPEGKP